MLEASPRNKAKQLLEIKVWGNFVAWQAALSFNYMLGNEAFKETDMPIIGVGTRRGSGFLLQITNTKDPDAEDLINYLHDKQEEALEPRGFVWLGGRNKQDRYLLSKADIAHCLCEFSKLYNILYRGKRGKHVYSPIALKNKSWYVPIPPVFPEGWGINDQVFSQHWGIQRRAERVRR